MLQKYRIEIRWAFLFLGMTLAWMLLEKLAGLHGKYIDYHLYLTNLYAIPAVWIYVLALRDKKRRFYNGQMSYKQGFIAGLIITVIVTVFSPLSQWIISNVITPEYFPNVIRRSVETGYYKTTAEAEAHFNYANYAKQSTVAALVMGLVTSAIVAFFLRTKKQNK
ncbi:MAG: DUF4199 domain-containing protein [Leadbetterella sp.]|nr:DUF4199 domain-containing protein [Leadbetterella sp.]